MIKERPMNSINDNLLIRISELSRFIKRTADSVEGIFSVCPISSIQFGLLYTISESTTSLGEIAKSLGMDRTTLTRNCCPLLREKLVVESDDNADKRKRKVVLTDYGKSIIKKYLSLWLDLDKELKESNDIAQKLDRINKLMQSKLL